MIVRSLQSWASRAVQSGNDLFNQQFAESGECVVATIFVDKFAIVPCNLDLTSRSKICPHSSTWRGIETSGLSNQEQALVEEVMHLSILGPTTPHTGHRWGLVGIIRDLHVNFDPRGGAFDQFSMRL